MKRGRDRAIGAVRQDFAP